MSERILIHPILGDLDNRDVVNFSFDGQTLTGYKGESLSAALLANGIRTLRVHEETASPRGIYCNIGHCFECRVTIDGLDGVRSCLTPLVDGMNITSGIQLETAVRDWRKNNGK